MTPASRARTRIGLSLLNGAFLAYFASCAWLGWQSRYASDDFCWSCLMRHKGFWGSQAHWFNEWTGRFAEIFTLNLLELAGPWIARVAPTVGLAAWLAATAWAIRSFASILGRRAALAESLLLAQALLFATLRGNPTLERSFFWLTSVGTYLAPLALLSALAGLAVRRFAEVLDAPSGRLPARRGGSALFLCGFALIAFWSAGYAETHTALQGGLFMAGLAVCALSRDGSALDRMRPLMRAGLWPTLAASLILTLAPGAAFRLAIEPRGPEPAGYLYPALGQAWAFLRLSAGTSSPTLAMIGLLGASFGAAFRSDAAEGADPARNPGAPAIRRALLWLPLAAAAIILVSFIPSTYGLSRLPPNRALFAPQFALVSALAAWGFFAGLLWLRPALTRAGEPLALRLWAAALAVWIALVVAFVAMLTLFPSALAGRGYALYRLLGRPETLTAGFLPLWCFFAYLAWLRAARRGGPAPAWLAGIAAAGMALWIVAAARENVAAASRARAYARAWDERDQEIRAAAARGERRLRIARLQNPSGIEDIVDEPWIADCAACFYGVDALEPAAVPNHAIDEPRKPQQGRR